MTNSHSQAAKNLTLQWGAIAEQLHNIIQSLPAQFPVPQYRNDLSEMCLVHPALHGIERDTIREQLIETRAHLDSVVMATERAIDQADDLNVPSDREAVNEPEPRQEGGRVQYRKRTEWRPGDVIEHWTNDGLLFAGVLIARHLSTTHTWDLKVTITNTEKVGFDTVIHVDQGDVRNIAIIPLERVSE